MTLRSPHQHFFFFFMFCFVFVFFLFLFILFYLFFTYPHLLSILFFPLLRPSLLAKAHLQCSIHSLRWALHLVSRIMVHLFFQSPCSNMGHTTNFHDLVQWLCPSHFFQMISSFF